MQRSKMRGLPVVTIHLHSPDKAALQRMADRKGMQVATLCRSILLKAIEDEEIKK